MVVGRAVAGILAEQVQADLAVDPAGGHAQGDQVGAAIASDFSEDGRTAVIDDLGDGRKSAEDLDGECSVLGDADSPCIRIAGINRCEQRAAYIDRAATDGFNFLSSTTAIELVRAAWFLFLDCIRRTHDITWLALDTVGLCSGDAERVPLGFTAKSILYTDVLAAFKIVTEGSAIWLEASACIGIAALSPTA